jgi:hypothetical protein
MDNRLGNMVAVVGVLVSPEDLDSPGEGMLGCFFLWGGVEWTEILREFSERPVGR